METDYLVKGGYCERMMEENVPDPDVTGWGIVSSFCFSIVMNMIAIIVAYATKALPEKRYNSIDDIIHSRGSSSADRKQRIKAFESFMLSLSDQQLVTGMALIPNYVFFSDEIIIVFNLSVLTYILISGYVQRLLQLYCPLAREEKDYWQRRSLRACFGPEAVAKFERLALAHNQTLADLRSSFLWEIVWLLFYFTFGTANLLEFFNDASLRLGAIKPNFGQLVPLFLLALPLITAAEAYSTATTYDELSSQDIEDITPLTTPETNPPDVTELLPTSHDSGSRHFNQSPGNQFPSAADTAQTLPTVEQMRIEEPAQLTQASETSAGWLSLLLMPYAAGLMLWALIFADVIPHSFFLSIAAWVIAFLVEVASFRSWFTVMFSATREVVRGWYLATRDRLNRYTMCF
ncbi:hypothetical protein CABS01_08909 [Colletotrichum abscissum]|uniref:uncharacterized protein n=1 Tax=Colletotrichum abscissum TaxID=1671311 RepID=UPI0027D7452F|nr:uncharacterized protein CABS01_08909 [Colletotrichum abscissum]KAK1503520.1 hypothetical protein CABS01_08909 [Colletotrichum abscissum]